MDKRVVGVYDNGDAALAAIEDLIRQGYDRNDISVVSKNHDDVDEIIRETDTKTEEGLATGAAAGGIIGGLAGFLAGASALAIPGIGPLIAAGPLVGALSGAALGAGTGGLAGALVGMGIPELEAEQYEREVKSGKILVLLNSDAKRHSQDNDTLADPIRTDMGLENNTLTNDTIGINGSTLGIPEEHRTDIAPNSNNKPY
ncbi:general stress protein [Neobacillus sp. SM06]|uniref:general stress protein n=1 Tax=Neobacillus sp. SM06 TaxID=3422492 RepID=UPI003D2C6FE0